MTRLLTLYASFEPPSAAKEFDSSLNDREQCSPQRKFVEGGLNFKVETFFGSTGAL